MTPAEVTAARKALGFTTAAALGRALKLEGRDPGRTVKRWETGGPIPGIATVAIELMLRNAALEAQLRPPAPYLAPVASEPPEAAPLRQRRRG